MHAFLTACGKEVDCVVNIDTQSLVSEGYIGNGVQWDPYELNYGEYGKPSDLSEEDWEKIYKRLDFMRPAFMRVCINTYSYMKNDIFDHEQALKHCVKILDYCQSRKVTVMFGDWGHDMCNVECTDINTKLIYAAAEYMYFLIEEKGYDCIKYYNMVNEPNGDWSYTKGNLPLWERIMYKFNDEIKRLQIDDRLSLVGPDVAIWTDKETFWLDSCAANLKDAVVLYDIHTYPSKITVNSGKYTQIIQAYKRHTPEEKKIVMGEIGFKYIEPEDSLFKKENIKRTENKRFASPMDSQMLVYDYMYGTDMADALFQTINAGYSGCSAWMLDDAMHNGEVPGKLKIWGMWNILGDEYFSEEEERIRPWYYAWSLLSRYIPAGSKIYKVDVIGTDTIKAIVAEQNGNYTIGIVNIGKGGKNIKLNSATVPMIPHIKQFIYGNGKLKIAPDQTLLPHAEDKTLTLSKGEYVFVDGETLVVYTNFNH